MKKKLRVLTDILMYVSMCYLIGTGLLIHYRLVPGFRGGHGLTLLGFDRHEWGTSHLWVSYVLIAFVVVHLVLNFAFVTNAIALRKRWLLAVLVAVGVAVVAFFLVAPIERSEESGGGRGGGGYRGGRGHTEVTP